METTFNFKSEPYDYTTPDEFKGTFKDSRNGVMCVDPTCDIECYLNYIEWLNKNKDSWRSYGYLDLGMMPLAMGPSFCHHMLFEVFTVLANQLKITAYTMKPVSLMFNECRLGEDDIWVFKKDLAVITGIPSDKITVERFIRWCESRGLSKLS